MIEGQTYQSTTESYRKDAAIAPGRILLVEDNPSDAYLIERILHKAYPAMEVVPADTWEKLDAELARGTVDLVLSDFRMPKFSGLMVIEHMHQYYPYVPVIILSGAVGEERAVELIKAGAADFLLKDRLDRLPRALHMALEQMRMKELKEQAEAEMKLVAYILSHDLRAPLNNLTALNEIMEEEFPRHDLVKRMGRSVDSLKETIDGLGQLVTSDHALDTDYEKVTIAHILDEIETDLATQIDVTDCTVLRRGYAGEITTKRPYFKSILSNLIGNAIKYHKPSVAPIVKVEIKKSTELEIRVEDNGLGMNMEIHGSHVFQPFSQLLEDNKDGFGLGLYIVKKQVERLNGSIYLRSEQEFGSTFEIKLPIK